MLVWSSRAFPCRALPFRVASSGFHMTVRFSGTSQEREGCLSRKVREAFIRARRRDCKKSYQWQPSVRLVSLPERDTVIAAPCTCFMTSTVANRSELSTLSFQYAPDGILDASRRDHSYSVWSGIAQLYKYNAP